MSLDLTREQSEWWGWIETIMTDGVNLTKWEEDFVMDLHERWEAGRHHLSERQAEILERIYAEKTP